MKIYLKNKNFIPRNYVNNIKSNKSEGDKRGLIYLVLINLLMLPISIEGLFEKEKPIEIEKPIIVEEVHVESIINWINEIDKEVISITVENNNAIMLTNSKEKIYSMEEKGNISINNISKNEKGYYILEITRKNK